MTDFEITSKHESTTDEGLLRVDVTTTKHGRIYIVMAENGCDWDFYDEGGNLLLESDLSREDAEEIGRRAGLI